MGSSQSGQAWVQGWGQVEVGGMGSQSVARARADGRMAGQRMPRLGGVG